MDKHIFNTGILAHGSDSINKTAVDEEIQKYDKTGYYPGAVGEIMMSRYVLLERVGKGSFSTIWLARDVKSLTIVIIKIKKNTRNYLETSFYEIEVFQKMMQQASSKEWVAEATFIDSCSSQKSSKKVKKPSNHIVKMLNAFIYESRSDLHFCMVFEVLDVSLRAIMDRYENKGIPLTLSRKIVKQILTGVHYLHQHCGLIHNNLQPENIMFNYSKEQKIAIDKKNSIKPTNDDPKKLEITKRIVKELNKNHDLSDKGRLTQPIVKLMNSLAKISPESSSKNLFKANTNTSFDSADVLEDGPSKNDQSEQTNIKPMPSQKEEICVLTEEQFKTELERLAKENNLTTKKELKNLKRKLKKKMKKYVYRANNFQNNDVSLRVLNGNNRERKYFPRNVKDRKNDIERAALPPNFKIKIIDFANSCWINRQFQNYYQTRNYKAPECILGVCYTATTDIWSVGCIVFEMLVGERLFSPKPNKNLTCNEEHLAMMIELLNDFPVNFSLTGTNSKKYFNSDGMLKKQPQLTYLNLKDTLTKIHKVKEDEAEIFSDFLSKMLNPSPRKRSSAWELLGHKWLNSVSEQWFATEEEILANPKIYGYSESIHKYEHEVVNEEEFDADNSFSSSEIDDMNDDENDYMDSEESELKFFDKSFKNTYMFSDNLENYRMDNTSCAQNDKKF